MIKYVGRMKWREVMIVLRDNNMPLKVKRRFCKIVVRPDMMYGAKCLVINKKEKIKIKIADMRMLRGL